MIEQLEIVPFFFFFFFYKFFRENCKMLQNHQTLPKSAEISLTIWIQLTLFWGMFFVFLCILYVYKVYFLQVSVYFCWNLC